MQQPLVVERLFGIFGLFGYWIVFRRDVFVGCAVVFEEERFVFVCFLAALTIADADFKRISAILRAKVRAHFEGAYQLALAFKTGFITIFAAQRFDVVQRGADVIAVDFVVVVMQQVGVGAYVPHMPMFAFSFHAPMVGGKFQPLPCAGRAAPVAGVAFFFIQQCPAVAVCFE